AEAPAAQLDPRARDLAAARERPADEAAGDAAVDAAAQRREPALETGLQRRAPVRAPRRPVTLLAAPGWRAPVLPPLGVDLAAVKAASSAQRPKRWVCSGASSAA